MNKTQLAAPMTSLSPILQKALGSLDLNLDAELIRYRRQRHTSSVKSKPVISETELSAKIHAYLVEKELGQQEANSIKDLKLPQFPESEPEIHQTSARIDDPKLSSLVHQATETETSQNEVVASSNIPPDDYLESSEQLLENLKPKNEPNPPTTPENHPFWTYLSTPLGVGSILLLLLTSLLLGSTLVTSEQWTRLGLERFLGNNKTNTNVNPETAVVPVPTANQATPQSVDLATQEFITLNLDNLSTLDVNSSAKTPKLQPESKPQSLPAPNPVISNQKPVPLPAPVGIPSDKTTSLANALLPPSLRPQPIPTYGNSNIPQITISSPQPLPPIPNLNGNLPLGTTKYYVVIKYDGDRSLQQVQAKIADAYVREFPQGKWIQVGVFAKQQDAQQLQTQLRKNGLNTEIIAQN